jgi:hypothetical protein
LRGATHHSDHTPLGPSAGSPHSMISGKCCTKGRRKVLFHPPYNATAASLSNAQAFHALRKFSQIRPEPSGTGFRISRRPGFDPMKTVLTLIAVVGRDKKSHVMVGSGKATDHWVKTDGGWKIEITEAYNQNFMIDGKKP